MAKLKTYRVWYKDGSARLVSAANDRDALGLAKEAAELDAADIHAACKTAKGKGQADRARELLKEYVGRTVPTKAEVLS